MRLPAGLAPLLVALVFESPLGAGDVAPPSHSPGHWRVELIREGVRLRVQPDVTSKALGSLHKGEVVDVLSWLPVAKSIPTGSDLSQEREPGFWIRVRDQRQREGWIASVFALPENAWPRTPWMLGHVEQATKGGFEPEAGRLVLDVVRIVDQGIPAWVPLMLPEDDALGERQHLLERMSALDSVELLEQDGRSEIAAAQGTAGAFDECPAGLGVGPVFAGSLREGGRQLGIAGLGRAATEFPLAEPRIASGRFFRFRDEKDLLRFLASAQPPSDLHIRALSDLTCSGPIALFMRSFWSELQLRSCGFSDGERRWNLLFGVDSHPDASRPWLVRFARPDGDNSRDDEVDVTASLDHWYVTDLNQDAVLELWFPSKMQGDIYRVFTWEIYFVDRLEAFGPWFIVADGGPACD